MNRGGITKDKRVLFFKEPQQKGTGSERESCWSLLEISILWTILLLWGRGCFITVWLSPESVALVSIRERFIPNLNKSF